ASRLKDEFLATLAHELRNPLAPVLNSLTLMQLAPPDGPESRHAREVIQRQIGQMVRLVDDLLDISRITRGKMALHKERLDLAAVVDRALETSRPLIESGKHELSVTLPQGTVLLDADAVRLAQVLSNLLNNAAKYTREGGHIRLSAELEPAAPGAEAGAAAE